jgi:uncharacterized C2H2 Zn-finger protein
MVFKGLWTCPRCGRMFANRNQSHSCGHHTVKQHLKGKSPHVRSLYEAFAALVEECGPVSIVPAKTRIGFQARMIFAAVTLRTDGLDGHVVLSRRVENPRFTRIESISPRSHVHHFRILSLEQLDGEVAGWLKEAYQVGEQKHLSR